MTIATLTEIRPAYLRVPDAARYLGISETVLRSYIRSGDLTLTYLSSHPTLKVTDLDALAEAAPSKSPA